MFHLCTSNWDYFWFHPKLLYAFIFCFQRNPTQLELQKYGELVNLDFTYFNSKFAENFEKKLELLDQQGNDLKVIETPKIFWTMRMSLYFLFLVLRWRIKDFVYRNTWSTIQSFWKCSQICSRSDKVQSQQFILERSVIFLRHIFPRALDLFKILKMVSIFKCL